MRQRRIAARSISKQVYGWLDRGQATARVFAVFDRACDLSANDGDVIALVAPQIGDGPLNVVLDDAEWLCRRIQPGTEMVYAGGQLLLSGGGADRPLDAIAIDLRDASLWEPRPGWDRLRTRRCEMRPGLVALRMLCFSRRPRSSFLPLLGTTHGRRSVGAAGAMCRGVGMEAVHQAKQATADLLAGWDWQCPGHVASVRRGGAALAGLGGGLTPAGDDFLVGLMLWAWLAHRAPKSFCQALVEEAAPRTTTLSAALLHAAAQGHCCAAWQRLLAALAQGREADVLSAGEQVLSCGASSGADALVGFLYMSL
jgi:hypothetical protein